MPKRLVLKCCYQRQHNGHMVECDKIALPLSEHGFCRDHQYGRVGPTGHWFLSSLDHKWHRRYPRIGDLRYERGKLTRYNGKHFRRCCRLCLQFGRPKYCRRHDPNMSTKLKSGKAELACQFFDWLELVTGTTVKHKHRNDDGWLVGQEFEIDHTKYRVDGYVSQGGYVIEFLGDFWHGNPHKYPGKTMNKRTGVSHGQTYLNTLKRLRHIASLGYKVFYIWESTWVNHSKAWRPPSTGQATIGDVMAELGTPVTPSDLVALNLPDDLIGNLPAARKYTMTAIGTAKNNTNAPMPINNQA